MVEYRNDEIQRLTEVMPQKREEWTTKRTSRKIAVTSIFLYSEKRLEFHRSAEASAAL
jgi:hypothetical protein